MLFRISVVLLAGLVISGCASIVEGTDQSIMVNLSPDEATCTVIREGAQVGTVSKSSKFINVSKSKNDLIIECAAPGHHEETLTVESAASGWGVVGCIFIDLCITDYSTRALNKYPKTISVTLAPKSFESAASRDAWYDRRRRQIERGWDRRIAGKETECADRNAPIGCKEELAEMTAQKTAELDRLELRRQKDGAIVPASGGGQTDAQTIEIRLNGLKDLLDRGVINQREYDAKRRQILSEL